MTLHSPADLNATKDDIVVPFEDPKDLFARKPMADKLVALFEKMGDGFVVSVDAEWGMGKTYFAKHTQAYLAEDKFHSVYIDAFKSDFIEDPFLMIAAQFVDAGVLKDKPIVRLLKAGGVTILKKAVAAGLAVADTATNGLVKNIQEAIKETKANAEADEKVTQELYNSYKDAIKSIEDFRETLTQEVRDLKKRVVVIIDELDRCNPRFTVQVLERIKHLFSVPGVIFMLVMNRRSIVSAVAGTYGLDAESANDYLSKFINLDIRLPILKESCQCRSSSENGERFLFCQKESKRYENPTYLRGLFDQTMPHFADLYDLTLREIEVAYSYWAIAEDEVCKVQSEATLSNPEYHWPTVIMAWLICTKIKERDLFNHLCNVDRKWTRNPENHTPSAFFYKMKVFNQQIFAMGWASGNIFGAMQMSENIKMVGRQISIMNHAIANGYPGFPNNSVEDKDKLYRTSKPVFEKWGIETEMSNTAPKDEFSRLRIWHGVIQRIAKLIDL